MLCIYTTTNSILFDIHIKMEHIKMRKYITGELNENDISIYENILCIDLKDEELYYVTNNLWLTDKNYKRICKFTRKPLGISIMSDVNILIFFDNEIIRASTTYAMKYRTIFKCDGIKIAGYTTNNLNFFYINMNNNISYIYDITGKCVQKFKQSMSMVDCVLCERYLIYREISKPSILNIRKIKGNDIYKCIDFSKTNNMSKCLKIRYIQNNRLAILGDDGKLIFIDLETNICSEYNIKNVRDFAVHIYDMLYITRNIEIKYAISFHKKKWKTSENNLMILNEQPSDIIYQGNKFLCIYKQYDKAYLFNFMY